VQRLCRVDIEASSQLEPRGREDEPRKGALVRVAPFQTLEAGDRRDFSQLTGNQAIYDGRKNG